MFNLDFFLSAFRDFPLSRTLCAKAASALRALEHSGRSPDPRLMLAVGAKLAYLDGRLSQEKLEPFRLAAEEARMYALRMIAIGPQSSVSKESIMNKSEFFAADTAVCAASITIYDSPLIVALSSMLRKCCLLKPRSSPPLVTL